MFKEIGVVSFGMAALCFVWFVEVSMKLSYLSVYYSIFYHFDKGLQAV